MEAVIDPRPESSFIWPVLNLLEFKVGRSYRVTSLEKDLVLRETPSLEGKAIRRLQVTVPELVNEGVNKQHWGQLRRAFYLGYAIKSAKRRPRAR